MRRATHETDFIYDGTGTFVGVNLGWDFCAEHEWGVRKLEAAFGHDESAHGVERRRARLDPKLVDHLRFFEHGDGTWVLAFHGPSWDGQPWNLGACYELNFRGRWNPELNVPCPVETCLAKKEEGCATKSGKRIASKFHVSRTKAAESHLTIDETVAAAWNDGTFAVRVHAKHREKLEMVYKAIVEGDAIIMLGGRTNPFSNSGLVIGIISRMPQALKDMMRELDLDYERLNRVAEKIGIEKELRAVGLTWFALQAKWRFGHGASVHTSPRNCDSAYPVVFWLNPIERQTYQSGWYTVEELRLWARGLGPVLKVVA